MMLHELPVDHPDRNKPLVGCFYRNKNANVWREVFPAFNIAKKAYNDLAPCWTDNDVWRW